MNKARSMDTVIGRLLQHAVMFGGKKNSVGKLYVAVMLQVCFSYVAVMLQLCCSYVAVMLQLCCSYVAVMFTTRFL